MTGRPVLGFGPVEVASMKILSENSIGCVINSDNYEDSKFEMLTFLENYNLRNELGKNGYAYAVKHFDKKNISQMIMSEFCAVVKY